MNESNEAFDSTGAGDDAAAQALISRAAAEVGKEVKSPAQRQAAQAPAADPGQPANEGNPDPAAAAAAAAKAAEEAKAKADAEAAAKAVADAKAAEEAKQQIKEAQDAGNRYEYNPTGDPGLDMALEFVGNLGFSAESTAIQAAQKGDFGPLKAALEVLGDKAKGWERHLALAQQSLERRIEAGKAKAEADEKAVYLAVGGKDEWEKIAQHARDNADDGEKAAIQAAMKAGGMQAQGMAVLLKQAYDKAHPKTPSVVRKDASGAPGGGSGQGPMTPAQYAAEVRKIAATTRGPIDNNPKYLALREQYARQ